MLYICCEGVGEGTIVFLLEKEDPYAAKKVITIKSSKLGEFAYRDDWILKSPKKALSNGQYHPLTPEIAEGK